MGKGPVSDAVIASIWPKPMSWLVWAILITGDAIKGIGLKAISVDFRHTLLMRASSMKPPNPAELPTLLIGEPRPLPPMVTNGTAMLVKPYVRFVASSTSALVRVGSIKVQ